MTAHNRYSKIIERIFAEKHIKGATRVEFTRDDIRRVASQLQIELPKNLGDLIYSFRYREPLPESIQKRASKGLSWIIVPAGRSRYRFETTAVATISPAAMLAETKVPDATPGIVSMYNQNLAEDSIRHPVHIQSCELTCLHRSSRPGQDKP